MDNFYKTINNLKTFFCDLCNQLWPTTKNKCETCYKTRTLNRRFTRYNEMVPNICNLPNKIKNHIENITMIEEMLISPILAVMTICRLPGGQLISKGYVANFAQDIMPLCKTLPRLTKSIPMLIVRKSDQSNNLKDFKVNRERVTDLLKFFCANNPDWKNRSNL